jgi:hypothetical protein
VPPLIAEELLVLGYEPDGIARGDATRLDAALAGAILLELMLDGSVLAAGDRISASDDAELEHPELASALARLPNGRPADGTVVALAPGLRRRLLAGLVERGVLGDVPHRWLGVLQRHRFPERDASVRADALSRLRSPADARTLALAAMIVAAGLADRIWSRDERENVRQQLAAFPEAAMVSSAVAKAVRTIHARTMT